MTSPAIDPPEAESSAELVARLAQDSRAFEATGAEPERNCWLAGPRHVHGVLPSEYDIREVPEDLYLAVLAHRRFQVEHGDGRP
jgi:hypothetical protein